MKAAVTEGNGDIRITDSPLPEAEGYRCLCRIQACASCSGTDLKIIQNRLPFEVPYPGIFGHESVGTVIEKGKKARHIKEGDRFLRPAAVYPDEKLGDFYSSWGGFAEYGLVTDVEAVTEDNPGADLIPYTKFQQKIPPGTDITPADATMLITLKEAASFISNIGVKPGSSSVVLGTGPVAKSMCCFLKLAGAEPVILVGRREEALEWAEEAGADLTLLTGGSIHEELLEALPGKADFIIDTTGSPELVKSLLGSLSPGGKAAPYATYPGENPFEDSNGARFIFSGPSEDLAHEKVLRLIEEGKIKPGMFYTRTLPLDEIAEGFKLLEERKDQKIVFEMEDSP